MRNIGMEDRKRIKEALQKKYYKVALTPEGNFQYPVGENGLKKLRYDPEVLNGLSKEILKSYCGVGNPFSLGQVNRGETMLDVGCGAGVDSMIAGTLVGNYGKAIGIDIVSEMLRRAQENLRIAELNNVAFCEASGEELPCLEASFDFIISNGAFNLIPDKLKALKESFRVLKPFGRLMIADQVLIAQQGVDISGIDNWAS